MLSKKNVLIAQFLGAAFVGASLVYALSLMSLKPLTYSSTALGTLSNATTTNTTTAAPAVVALDTADYDQRMWANANNGTSTKALIAKALWLGSTSSPQIGAATSTLTTATTSASSTLSNSSNKAIKKFLWPVRAPYPLAGSILPFHRIIAYYGNFYSKGMGVLGQYPEDVMLMKLAGEVAKWNAADPETPALPAIDYIAVTAQGSPGKDNKYRLRMPDSQIDHALELADRVHGIVILDVQVGLSSVQVEIPELEKYLKLPNVHLAIDPEFSMKTGDKPGSVIGTFNAGDINYTANYLAKLVHDNNLPPKVLIVHRFTQGMVRGAKQITPLPEVQVVIDMDGWGGPAKKIGTYTYFVAAEPVQFTGFKLFYKNDLLKPSTRILTPRELLTLSPKPLFIQFQ